MKQEQHSVVTAWDNMPTEAGREASSGIPSSRYFQIHFEHMEAQIQQIIHALEILRAQVAEIDRQLRAPVETRAGESPSCTTDRANPRESAGKGNGNGKRPVKKPAMGNRIMR